MKYLKFLETKYALAFAIILYMLLPLDFNLPKDDVILAIEPVIIYGIISAIIAAATTVYSASEQAKISKYNAALNERAAEQKRLEAQYAADMQEKKNEQTKAQQRLAFNVSGVTTEGTPTNLFAQTAESMELDALAIRYGGESAGAAFKAQANINRMTGRATMIAGHAGATSSLLSSSTSIYKAYKT